MKFRDFEKKYGQYPFISTNFLKYEEEKFIYLTRLISEWKTKNWIIQLKKGIYVINKEIYTKNLSSYFIANNIYIPSYISLQSALSFYNLIPEGVFTVTSISSKKKQQFTNKMGNFSYHHLKKSLFFGFTLLDYQGQKIFFARAEKAFLDFVYLHFTNAQNYENFYHSYRLQNLQILKIAVLEEYLAKFKNKNLEKTVKNILKYAQKLQAEFNYI